MVRQELQRKYDQAEEKTYGRMNRRPPLDVVDQGISASEEILSVLKCLDFSARPTTIVLTSLGMHFFSQGMYLRSATASHEFVSFSTLTGVRAKKLTFGGAELEVTRANNMDLFTWCSPRDCEVFVNIVKQKMANPEPAAQMDATDPLDQIKKLKELLELGLISQSEYDQKRQKLLDTI
jgi:hypothetical protein